MRAERGRKKKLIVAFHFFRGEQAGWNCEQCRQKGLETKRRCGFLPEDKRGAPKLVWVRGKAATEECPRSVVTPASMELLEKFLAWKMWRGANELTPREGDAFVILEKEWRAEQANGQ